MKNTGLNITQGWNAPQISLMALMGLKDSSAEPSFLFDWQVFEPRLWKTLHGYISERHCARERFPLGLTGIGVALVSNSYELRPNSASAWNR